MSPCCPSWFDRESAQQNPGTFTRGAVMSDASEIITEAEMPQALATLFKRVQTDADFRQLCLQNPGAAIFEITGKRLPEGSTLSFANPEGVPLPE